MAKRGRKPKNAVRLLWNAKFAYGIGLISSDGNLSPDGRHIAFTSKDLELIENFLEAFDIDSMPRLKGSGSGKAKKYYVIQFSDVTFYRFLETIGLTPNKSKTISRLDIPAEYLFDYLRGVFDGDGSVHGYYDPRWRSSYMFYLSFASASRAHLEWIQSELSRSLQLKGHITGRGAKGTAYQLKFAKREAVKLVGSMFYDNEILSLSRKRLKIRNILRIIHGSRK